MGNIKINSKDIKLENVLNNIIDELYSLFIAHSKYSLISSKNIKRRNIFIWLFDYNKFSDSLIHWKIFPYQTNEVTLESFEITLKDSVIKGGNGTIGYVLKTGKTELVNNTFLDPRGTVSFEDEVISNCSWAGIPFPLNSKDNEVQCILSFFYQDFDFFNLKYKKEIIEVLSKKLKPFEEKILLFNQIKKLDDINAIVLKPQKSKTYFEVLNVLNEVLSTNSKFYYTGIISINKDKSYKLDNILFDTHSIENKLKDTINWCSISKNKCVAKCFENEIHKINSCSECAAFDGFYDHCEIWENYFKYLHPLFPYSINFDSLKFIYYLSNPLNEIETKLFYEFNKWFYDSILKEINSLNQFINTVDNKATSFKLKKRLVETELLIFQLLIKALYAKEFDSEDEKKMRKYFIFLSKTFSVIKSDNSNPKSILIEENYDKIIGELNPGIKKIISETKFSYYIIATEFWETYTDAIRIEKINNKQKMNLTRNYVKNIENHSNISVIKRAIQEELVKEGLGNEIFQNYTPLFFADLNQKKIIPYWDNNTNSIKIDSKKIYWSKNDLNYLQSLIINSGNFSNVIYKNIKNQFSQISHNNIYQPFFSNSFIKVDQNKFLYPYDNFDALTIGEKCIIAGTEGNENINDMIKKYAEILRYKIELIENEKERKKHALNSAIAAIMSRNMSHNVGSHISYRSTNIKIKERIKELCGNDFIFNPEVIDWLDFMAEKLDKYEIYRNEYLSDYDQAPRNIYFYKDVVLPFCENTFVMDSIAASENANYINGYENRLSIRCKINSEEINAEYPNLSSLIPSKVHGNDISYPYNFPYLIKNKDFNEGTPTKNSLESGFNFKKIIGKDIEIAVHSEQAIYSILENFIRNSAKHNKDKINSEGLIITLDLREEENDFYSLYLYDNVSQEKPIKLYNYDSNNPGIFQRIEQSLLSDGKTMRENLGFADMKINSFLLYHGADEIKDSRLSENFNLVNIYQSNNDNSFSIIDQNTKFDSPEIEYRFGYKIRLSKARKILWIGALESGYSINELSKNGLIKLDSLDSINNLNKSGLASFQFVVFNNTFDYRKYLLSEVKFPGRVIIIGNVDYITQKPNIVTFGKKSDFNNKTVDQILELCWEIWLKKRVGKQIFLYVHFEDDNFSNQWNNISLDNNFKFVTVDSLSTEVQLNQQDFNIVYSHHGNAFKDDGGKLTVRQNNYEEVFNFYTENSIISFDKGSADYADLAYPKGNLKQRVYELMDAASTNIFVLDERIAASAQKEYTGFKPKGKNIPISNNWLMYAAGKVFVFSEIQTEGNIFSVTGNLTFNLSLCINQDISVCSKMPHLTDIDKLRKDIIIIHRTFLDKSRSGVDTNKFLELLRSYFGTVIITSGGGYPHNIKIETKFIPFSLIEQCIGARLSKIKLNSITQARTKL